MNNWFECKIQYEKIGTEDAKQKKVTDTYLVDAVNFTEAEARIIEVVRPFMSGEFTVSNIKRTKLYEIFDYPTGDRWFKAKVLFIILDPEKGVEKRVPSTMLVQAETIREALDRLDQSMKGTMSDYEVATISDTPILDVVPYGAKIDTENAE